jgi:hypothetical protein
MGTQWTKRKQLWLEMSCIYLKNDFMSYSLVRFCNSLVTFVRHLPPDLSSLWTPSPWMQSSGNQGAWCWSSTWLKVECVTFKRQIRFLLLNLCRYVDISTFDIPLENEISATYTDSLVPDCSLQSLTRRSTKENYNSRNPSRLAIWIFHLKK